MFAEDLVSFVRHERFCILCDYSAGQRSIRDSELAECNLVTILRRINDNLSKKNTTERAIKTVSFSRDECFVHTLPGDKNARRLSAIAAMNFPLKKPHCNNIGDYTDWNLKIISDYTD